ncbi:hypothetical protein [Micromonospora pisi]|nr:hypothetical protein [Micromonospora pisi]
MTIALTCAMFGCSRAAERPVARPVSPVVTGSPTTPADATPPAPVPVGSAATVAPDVPAQAAPDGQRGTQGTGGRPEPAGDRSTAPAAPIVPAADDPSCAPAVLLPATRALVDDRAAGVAVDRVEVFGCRNAYARLIALPARTSDPILSDQVFLHLESGTWRLVGRAAAGLDCGDDGLPADIATACAALSR